MPSRGSLLISRTRKWYSQLFRQAGTRSSSPTFISDSSSQDLTMAHQLDIIDGISDDISIARGLLDTLERPLIPLRRRTSFTDNSRGGNLPDGSNEHEESTATKDEGRRRRMIQSSNTWTTSSGEVLSDLDDVEDRVYFVQEYNRLAKKVCWSTAQGLQ
jgi:hypothetical protein